MAVMVTATSFRATLRRQFKLLRQGQGRRWNSTTATTTTTTIPTKTKPTLDTSTTATAAKPADAIPAPNGVATTSLPLWQRLGPLTRAAEAYGRSQRKRPYITQLVSTLVVYLAADISAQHMSGKPYDPARTARSLTIGGIAAIPAFKWFVWLANSFNYPSSRLLSIATKVAVNQLCFVPVFNSYFFGMQAILAGDTVEETLDHIRRTVPTSFVNSCKLWPPVTAFNFAFVPLEYRSIFGGIVGVGWQTYLAFLNRQAEAQKEYEHEHGNEAATVVTVATPREVGVEEVMKA